jgi:UDP-N-acetylmuramate dehydrogenase
VARSLQAKSPGVEIAWIGGHRGLEAQVVPDTGIPFRRLMLRSLRSVDMDVHVILDPIRLSLSVPQALAMLAWRRPDAIFTTGGYVSLPALLAASAMRIPVVMWDGNVVPGRSVRVTARLAGCLAVTYESTCKAMRGSRPCFVTGTPIRDPRQIGRAEARAALGVPADERLVLVFGGSQSVRRFNSAVAEALPRLVEKVSVLHVTGDDGFDQAVHNRDLLPDDLRHRYRPERFLGDEMTEALAAADLVVGRAGSSTLSEVAAFGLPMVVVPYPHAAGHQRRNAEELARVGGARLVEDEAFDADALLAAAAILDDPALHDSMAAAARSLARPGAADAVVELVLAAANRRPLPEPAHLAEVSKGAATAAAPAPAAPAPATAAAPAPPDWPALAADLHAETGLRGRLAASMALHTTMRVGGPADILVEVRSTAALRAALSFARRRGVAWLVVGRGSDLVVSDAGIRGMVVVNHATDVRIEGERLIAAAGTPLAMAATVAGSTGLSGLEFGLAIPGSVGGAVWANAGAHGSDVATVIESAELLRPDGDVVTVPAAELGLSYRDSRLKRSHGDASDVVLSATFRLSPLAPEAIGARLDEIRRWRREHQPLTRPSAGSIFKNPEGDSAGRLIDAAGLKGAREGGAMVSPRHANFIVNAGSATAADVRMLAEKVRGTVEARFGVRLVFEVEFVGDWSGWSEEAK